MKTYTNDELKAMKYNDVINVAKEIGIEFKLQKKGELIDLILAKQGGSDTESSVEETENTSTDSVENSSAEEVNEADNASSTESSEKSEKKSKEKAPKAPRKLKSKGEKKQDVIDQLNKDQRRIYDDENISKSEKMRRLFKRGLTIAQISHLMEAHYSFVFGVISRFKNAIPGTKVEETSSTKGTEGSAE